MRRLLLGIALLVALAPDAAQAATRSELTDFADRAAVVWADRQDEQGFHRDPLTGRRVAGYGNAMLGYALVRAGERRDDPGLVRAGVKAIATTLDEPPADRGVFDLLGLATAYNFARERLPGHPALARWEAYLLETLPPNVDNEVEACIVAPDCFHNHEAVGATAALELLRTKLASKEPGTRLADRETLRREALREVGEIEPGFARGDAYWTDGEETERDLALLSDTGNWPLAYHALSTAMLARSVELLGDEAPEQSRAALRRTVGALAAFMAPDGTVAYIGKRQESLWSLAATIAAAEIAVAASDTESPQRFRAASDRAFARLRVRYPLTSRGLPIVPRSGHDAFAPTGVDGDPMTFNGLALLLLNLAADAAPEESRGEGAALRADTDGAFVDRGQNGFAAVRHGDVWFAVHRHDRQRDVRNDFGFMLAKWRAPSGGWVDLLRPRPMRFDAAETAGPVVRRGGRRLLPSGGALRVREGGTIEVDGALGGEPTAYRFAPVERGVRLSLPARAGDVVTYTAYLSADGARVGDGAAADRHAVVTATPRPASIRLDDGFASCCDARMVAARIRVAVAEDGVVAFTVTARPDAPAPAVIDSGAAPSGDGMRAWTLALGALVLIAGALVLLRRRAVVRRRRRERERARRRSSAAARR